MMRAAVMALALAATACGGSVHGGETRERVVFEPVDESAQDASFAAFRAELLDAIERRDGGYILSIVADDVRVSFGADNGIEAFREAWRLDDADSAFWSELETVLRLGGVFHGQERFVAPYVFANWPDAHDPFTHIAVTGDNVAARSAPSATAPVVARLGHEIVGLPEWNPTNGFHRIALADGTTAFAPERQLRSPIDYRASFVRGQGGWKLQFFIAGD